MNEKSCFIFYCLFIWFINISGVQSAIQDRLKKDFFNIYKHTAIQAREITSEPVSPDKIKFFLYTRRNPNNYKEIDPLHPEELVNKNVKIVFIIHGWTSSREAEWYEDLKNAFLNRNEEFYIVQVDWSDPANQLYTISSYNTKDVGNIIGKFLVDLHKNYSIPINNFLLVGHSLGGQVSGYIAKKVKQITNKKLPRIIAMDPAGPLFSTRPDNERLNKNDAEVVEVIHTDGGTFGFKASCGTIDFFPNGGNGQPGCTRIDILDITSVADPVMCDHHRAWAYFIEAVLNPGEFKARKCASWDKFKEDKCDREEVAMGDLKTTLTGDFFLETNKDKPFAKKKKEKGKIGSGILKLLQH